MLDTKLHIDEQYVTIIDRDWHSGIVHLLFNIENDYKELGTKPWKEIDKDAYQDYQVVTTLYEGANHVSEISVDARIHSLVDKDVGSVKEDARKLALSALKAYLKIINSSTL